MAAPRPLTPAERAASDAWDVHRALIMQEKAEPSLRDNALWRLHRAGAFENYFRMLERC